MITIYIGMIRLTKIIEDLTKTQVKNSVDPSLLELIEKVISDTNILVVNNLTKIKKMLSDGTIDKVKLDEALSNYKRYFNRDGKGTDEVKRGMSMQSKLDELAK